MAFSFLHTGDWHIAKPFGRFPTEIASLLRAARLGIVERLAGIARHEGVGHVLVAGDIYDHSEITNKALMEPLERMKSAADIVWHLIPGNHDPGEPGGIWERVVRRGLPANVQLHLDAGPVPLTPDVVLLPAPIRSRRLTRDPTLWMTDAVSGDSVIRIGLAHGPVATFGSAGAEGAVHIDPRRAEVAGLTYLALGDWHGVKQIGPRTWYAGTPEPEQFPDNEPGYAVVVRLSGARAPPSVERVATARYVWCKRRLVVSSAQDMEDFVREIEALGGRGHDMLVELNLDGEITLADDGIIEALFDRLEAHLFHLVRHTNGLRLAPQNDEITGLADHALRDVAARIASRAREGREREQRVAERALRRLFVLARSVAGEAG